MKEILSKYLSSTYYYLKNIKLCANILVKNVFTSDIEYSPLEHADVRGGGYYQPPPREMCLPLPKGSDFLDVYDYVCFPYEEKRKHDGGNEGGSAGSPGRPKILKGMKPGTMLVSVSKEGDERKSRLTESSTNQVMMKGMSSGRPARRSGDRTKAKKPMSVGGGGVEYFVQRETDDVGRSGNEILFGKSRNWRLAEHFDGRSGEHERGGESGGGGAVRPSVSWDEPQSKEEEVKEEEEEEMGVHMLIERGTKVGLARENASRPTTMITLKKTKTKVSLEVHTLHI